MPVRVKVPTIMRNQVGGEPVVEGSGPTLGDLLDDLDRRFPGFKQRIVTEDGGIHRFVNLYVNDEDVRYLGSLETAVKEGDTVSILPAVAGGSGVARLAHKAAGGPAVAGG
jgi:sulfur-carrier protein